MGDANRRRAEIARLKALSPEQRQEREDEACLQKGIDPKKAFTDSSDILAMARRLHAHFEQAKATRNIDVAVQYLLQKVDGTVYSLRDIPVACAQGCSHCCTAWVSVSAPEALYLAKLVTAMGQAAMDKVRAAHAATREIEFEVRIQHPHDCPMLKDNLCTIYENRPNSCRQAVSGNKDACARAFRNITNETIPTPVMYAGTRAMCSAALYAALSRSALENGSYEFSAAITRVLDTPDAERRWLEGEAIFNGVLRERTISGDFAHQVDFVRGEAFGN